MNKDILSLILFVLASLGPGALLLAGLSQMGIAFMMIVFLQLFALFVI